MSSTNDDAVRTEVKHTITPEVIAAVKEWADAHHCTESIAVETLCEIAIASAVSKPEGLFMLDELRKSNRTMAELWVHLKNLALGDADENPGADAFRDWLFRDNPD